MTKFFRAIFTILTISLLSACGGGGGSAGNTSGTVLFTTAASEIVLVAGDVQTYNIGGGVPGYTATSNSGVVVASVSGKVLTLKGVGSGSATITVTDSAGAKVSIAVQASTGVPLFTTASEALSIGIGRTSTSFTIGGGSGVFTVASGNRQIVSVVQNGNQFTITGVSVGQTPVTITDSLGAFKRIDVTVGSGINLFTTSPSSIVLGVGATSQIFTIGGGSELYSVTTADPSVAIAGQSGTNQFVITGKATGKTTISVKDSLGTSLDINVTVGSGDSNLYSTAPSSVTLAVGGSGIYKVGGGSGNYAVVSSDTSVATASISGGDLTIVAVASGNTIIKVTDSKAATLDITVNVGGGAVTPLFSTAPTNLVLNLGSAPSYAIGGGRAPYAVSSSNPAVATASILGGTLSITPLANGNAVIVVTDAAGTRLLIDVTIGGGAAIPLFTTAPSAVTITAGATAGYSIGGGTAPYSVTSSNTNVATVSLTGTTYTVSALTVGNANLSIRDTGGNTSLVSVNVVGQVQTSVDVLPGNSTGAVGDTLSFNITGGSSPYTILNNNPNIATVTQSASSFTAKLLNVGSTTVTITDKLGQSKNVTITAGAVASQLRISPSSISLSEDSKNPVDLYIYGGTGPYRVFTTNLVLSSVPTGDVAQTAPGTKFTVDLGTSADRCTNATGATVTITVVDSVGASATATVSIVDNGKGGAGCN